MKSESLTKISNLRKIEQSEQRFQGAIAAVEGILWTNNPNGEMQGEQPGWAELTGQSYNEYQGYGWADAVHPDDAQLTIDAWNGAVLERKTFVFEHRVRMKNGQYGVFSIRAIPLFNKDGSIWEWVGVHTNITKQRLAEQALEQSDQRFQNLVREATVGIIVLIGEQMIVKIVNDAYGKLIDRSVAELIGKPLFKIIPETEEHFRRPIIDKVRMTGEPLFLYGHPYFVWVEGVKKDGFLNLVYQPYKEADGTITGVMVLCQDVTSQVLAIKKIEDNEERLKIVIDSGELGIGELNLKTNEINYSARYLEIYGYSNGESITQSELLKHIHPDDIPVRARAFKQAFADGNLHYEIRLIWNDKSIHWIEGRGKIFYDEDRLPAKLIGTIRDITEEKYYQQNLEEREQRFRLLADSMPQFVWTADSEGNLNYYNKAVYDYSGLTPKELQNDEWLQIVHPDEREENVRQWIHSITTGEDFVFSHRFRKYDGEYRWQLSRATPHKDEGGNIQIWVGTSTDINEIKELDRQKDNFISMASHELKTPLTTIKAYGQIAETILEKKGDAETLGIIKKMGSQINRLSALAEDLLNITKIRKGNLLYKEDYFDFNELVNESIDDMQKTTLTHQIRNNSGENAKIFGDKDKLNQVLNNLISNAIKYSPNANEIIVATEKKFDSIQLTVQDFGIGISSKEQQHVFEQFYRVQGDKESTFPGMGIGLFVCSEIITRHGGSIWVESELNKGSTFYTCLPFDHRNNSADSFREKINS